MSEKGGKEKKRNIEHYDDRDWLPRQQRQSQVAQKRGCQASNRAAHSSQEVGNGVSHDLECR